MARGAHCGRCSKWVNGRMGMYMQRNAAGIELAVCRSCRDALRKEVGKSADEALSQLSQRGLAVLMILHWEKARPAPVTVPELVERLGFSTEQAKDAFGELIAAGLVEMVASPEYRKE